MYTNDLITIIKYLLDHPFKTSACIKGGGVSLCADGPKIRVYKDQISTFCWNADGRGVMVKNRENLPTSPYQVSLKF